MVGKELLVVYDLYLFTPHTGWLIPGSGWLLGYPGSLTMTTLDSFDGTEVYRGGRHIPMEDLISCAMFSAM